MSLSDLLVLGRLPGAGPWKTGLMCFFQGRARPWAARSTGVPGFQGMAPAGPASEMSPRGPLRRCSPSECRRDCRMDPDLCRTQAFGHSLLPTQPVHVTLVSSVTLGKRAKGPWQCQAGLGKRWSAPSQAQGPCWAVGPAHRISHCFSNNVQGDSAESAGCRAHHERLRVPRAPNAIAPGVVRRSSPLRRSSALGRDRGRGGSTRPPNATPSGTRSRKVRRLLP